MTAGTERNDHLTLEHAHFSQSSICYDYALINYLGLLSEAVYIFSKCYTELFNDHQNEFVSLFLSFLPFAFR